MFCFINVSYIWHFQWTSLRYIYGIFYIVANCTSIKMIIMYVSRTWKYVCCSYPNKFAITMQCIAYINYVFLEDKNAIFTFPFFWEINHLFLCSLKNFVLIKSWKKKHFFSFRRKSSVGEAWDEDNEEIKSRRNRTTIFTGLVNIRVRNLHWVSSYLENAHIVDTKVVLFLLVFRFDALNISTNLGLIIFPSKIITLQYPLNYPSKVTQKRVMIESRQHFA